MIKPSSPTPLHLRSFKLSLIDQLASPVYIPILFFYTGKDGDNLLQSYQVPQKLKASLSKTLAIFYPLAGRIKDDDTIDCNDEGVEIFDARVKIQLSEFLKKPHMEILDQLVPGDSLCTKSGAKDVPLAIQVNSFECGGVAIGVRLSHKIADGAAMVEFISKWAATARGTNEEAMDATLVSASLFPPRSSVLGYMLSISETIVMRQLVLDAYAIASLRARATGHHPPTRVEAVAALIWRCFMKAKRDKRPATVSVSNHAVNLRGRMVPPVQDSCFGNLSVYAVTKGVAISECNGDMQGCLEKELREAVRAIDSDFIEELKGPNGARKAHEAMKNMAENYLDSDIHVCSFSSWCRFPFYEVDFGWGKPTWVSCCTLPMNNLAIFIDRRCDDGIEAWVNMEADEMAIFEQDQELLSFVSIP
ncbi:vinorine synthase-like protein [Cinnamomum micranthum f. kanehirae]|uniref:Vinorine synthase-like protein n=1 Tax=Cinnamomum micranthum f. kanehirae TaxID=337451 RepID=A0A443N561_9MAGN|nr:vinorine synthase-like protein [Cinnamomum micranthum f. kanehirae]